MSLGPEGTQQQEGWELMSTGGICQCARTLPNPAPGKLFVHKNGGEERLAPWQRPV